MQTWYRPSPYGVYPRGNMKDTRDITERFGTLSTFVRARASDDKEYTELPFIELMQALLSFIEVPDLCRLSRTCTGFYVMVHCTDALKGAYTLLSPGRLRFHHSWKETAVRGYLRSTGALPPALDDAPEVTATTSAPAAKKARVSGSGKGRWSGAVTETSRYTHAPVAVSRRFYCDQLFQVWLCTILPPYYHLRYAESAPSPSADVGHSVGADDRDVLQLRKRSSPIADNRRSAENAAAATATRSPPAGEIGCDATDEVTLRPQYKSAFKPVPRCAGLSADEFYERFEKPNLPVILTDIATEWPLFKILDGKFANLAAKKEQLLRPGSSTDTVLRCEYTDMTLDEYVRYASEQNDERPIYMFDAEYWRVLDAERLYTVPAHFARDDFFSAMGPDRRPKYRWIIAGPVRGGSSFHVDPNYTNAWNANLTGRKRWLLFPPGATPPGCVPSEDMSEVATPLSLTEWLLNFYDASVEQLRHVGYECICEPGDIMFVPCGWWHSVVNLEDSVAITHNYVSSSNLTNVLMFLRAMKGSISGINEDGDDVSEEATARRRRGFAEEFVAAMRAKYPQAICKAEAEIAKDHEERLKRRVGHLTMLESGSSGFTFDF